MTSTETVNIMLDFNARCKSTEDMTVRLKRKMMKRAIRNMY